MSDQSFKKRTIPSLVSRRQAASMLNVSVSSIDRLRRDKAIDTCSIGGRRLIPTKSLIALLVKGSKDQ